MINAPKTEADRQTARARFEQHFGEIDLGFRTGSDNEAIDADLARQYAEDYDSELARRAQEIKSGKAAGQPLDKALLELRNRHSRVQTIDHGPSTPTAPQDRTETF
jgi:hypothetical protein